MNNKENPIDEHWVVGVNCPNEKYGCSCEKQKVQFYDGTYFNEEEFCVTVLVQTEKGYSPEWDDIIHQQGATENESFEEIFDPDTMETVCKAKELISWLEPIASAHISNTGGVVIYGLNDDQVVVGVVTDHEHERVILNLDEDNGDADHEEVGKFFEFVGAKWYLDEFMMINK